MFIVRRLEQECAQWPGINLTEEWPDGKIVVNKGKKPNRVWFNILLTISQIQNFFFAPECSIFVPTY